MNETSISSQTSERRVEVDGWLRDVRKKSLSHTARRRSISELVAVGKDVEFGQQDLEAIADAFMMLNARNASIINRLLATLFANSRHADTVPTRLLSASATGGPAADSVRWLLEESARLGLAMDSAESQLEQRKEWGVLFWHALHYSSIEACRSLARRTTSASYVDALKRMTDQVPVRRLVEVTGEFLQHKEPFVRWQACRTVENWAMPDGPEFDLVGLVSALEQAAVDTRLGIKGRVAQSVAEVACRALAKIAVKQPVHRLRIGVVLDELSKCRGAVSKHARAARVLVAAADEDLTFLTTALRSGSKAQKTANFLMLTWASRLDLDVSFLAALLKELKVDAPMEIQQAINGVLHGLKSLNVESS